MRDHDINALSQDQIVLPPIFQVPRDHVRRAISKSNSSRVDLNPQIQSISVGTNLIWKVHHKELSLKTSVLT